MIISEINQIEEYFYNEIQKDFDINLVNMRDRIRIIADIDKFKDIDKDVWEQKHGIKPKYYSVYFDSEFVCSFDSYFLPEGIKLVFLRNLTQLYKKDMIRFKLEDVKELENKEKEDKKTEKFKKIAKVRKADISEDEKDIVISLINKNDSTKRRNTGRTDTL